MISLVLSFYIAVSPGITGSAVEAMNFIKEDIKPVIQFSMDWAARCALAATSTHAFIVVCKRFIQ